MNNILKIKLNHKDSIVPSYQTKGAAGMDLHAYCGHDGHITLLPHTQSVIPTGISVQVPEGFEGQVRSRSGLAAKQAISVLNSPGTIDSDYRGEVQAILYNHSDRAFLIRHGDRIAQLVICPMIQATIEITNQLEESIRGVDGLGSTGV